MTVATRSAAGAPPTARHELLVATYRCIARRGLARLTVEDAAREAGVSRATVYRHFPGGREELVREAVGHEVAHFFLDLAEATQGAVTLAEVIEVALLHAHATVVDHEVLHTLLATEPERLLVNLTVEAHRLLPPIAAFLRPHVAAEAIAPGVEVDAAAEYVARMVLSLVGAPAGWDLTDPAGVGDVVRSQILAGIAAPPVVAARAGVGGDEPAPVVARGHRGGAVQDRGEPEGALLSAATRCLARWGVAKTSLDDIAREGGVSRATAYRHFPGGKDTIIRAVAADELARFGAELAARLGSVDTLEALLVEGITFTAVAVADHEVLQQLLAHEPELVLPQLAFTRFEVVLAAAAEMLAPHLHPFLDDSQARRAAEWVTRVVVSYSLSPSPRYDFTERPDVAGFVRSFLLPGLLQPSEPAGRRW